MEESIDDMYVEEAELDEDIAEADGEVDRVLADVLNAKFDKVASPSQGVVAAEPVATQPAAAEIPGPAEQAEDEASLESMRGHLEALKS